MARSLVIDEYRKKSHRRSVPIEGVDESVFTDDTDTTVDTETALTHKKVLAVVRTLKAEYQDVIFMHYVEEMPVRAIADQLQENENAVRVRLHRALASVRKLCTV
jgi:RNA polymerase sigma factor (sigma-70 family)